MNTHKARYVVIILALLVAVIGVVLFIHHRNAADRYEVKYDETMFQSRKSSHFYSPEDTVKLTVPMIATDTDYYFYVDGVDHFESTYNDKEGYVITFVMPSNTVSVTYSIENNMERF